MSTKCRGAFLGVEPDIAPQVGVDGVLDDGDAVLLEERPNLRRKQGDGPVEDVFVRLEAPRRRRPRRDKKQKGDEANDDRFAHTLQLLNGSHQHRRERLSRQKPRR